MLRLSARLSLRPRVIMSKPRTFKSTPSKASEEPPAGYSVDPAAPPMLRYQTSLPRLPVPTLESTAAKYLETVRPHVTPEAFNKTSNAVSEFLKSSTSRELQKRLQARATDPSVANWLADWWNDVAYMSYRDPVVVFVSYFFVHLDDHLRKTAPTRAAALIKAMLPFRHMTVTGQLEPEKVRGAPLCMDSNKWLFHSSRYPTKPSDTAKSFDAAEHNHIVVLRKNRFFEVSLVTSEGRELSAAEIEVQMERIMQSAGKDKAVPVGALTSDNRDIWFDARQVLLKSEVSAESLKRIESAAIVLCLDDTSPVTREDISWQCWVGDGRNRWFDKQQLIVYENGRSGFLGEHSCMDGTSTLRMNEFILATIARGKADLGPARTSETATNLPHPTELKFDISSEVKSLVAESEKHFDTLVGEHDMEVLHYEGYGKNFIKKHKASPDAWAQLVKQLAFHKMFGRPGITYESCQTRKFQLGRTEVIRSASNESKAWAEAMLNPKETDKRRAALFRAAVARHLQYAAWAADGQGVDRHLFGLKRMLKDGEEAPAIYSDPSFSATNHWELSTSQLSSDYLDGWGYGEVVPDGYGLSYSIGNDYIRWTVTSLKRKTAEFKHYLAEAATETREMMDRAAVEEKSENAAKPKL